MVKNTRTERRSDQKGRSEMKKIVALLLLVALSSLVGCSNARTHCGITPITDERATDGATEETFDRLEIGMSYADVERLEIEHLVAGYYAFTKNATGNAVVGRFDPDTLTIAEIDEFPAVSGDADAFASITPGMTVSDVVRAVGLPLGSRTFGLNTLDFACSDGSAYRVQWNEDMTVLAVAPVPD